MDLSINKGAYISEVVDGGPSERAGLRGAIRDTTIDGQIVEVGGDVIIAIDGQPVTSFEDLLIYIALSTSPGQDATLTVLRDGQTREITVTLGSRPRETFEPFRLP
jgi:2-alkenal reductase